MLHKKPKSGFWKIVKTSAKTLFVIEAFCFAASYGVYHRMNTNREFRQYINDNFPIALDYFYKVGEVIGNSNLREVDANIWRVQEQQQQRKKE